MPRTLSEIFGWIKGKLLSYLLIVLILLGGIWAQGQIAKTTDYEKQYKDAVTQIAKIEEQLQQLKTRADPLYNAYLRALAALQAKELERAQIVAENPFKVLIPFTADWTTLQKLDLELKGLNAAVEITQRAIDQKTRVLIKSKRGLEAAKAKLDKALVWAQEWKKWLPIFWTAAGVLVAAILGSVGIKLFLYFVVAPIASRRPSIRLLPDAVGAVQAGSTYPIVNGGFGHASSISIPLHLQANQELLIKPEYLQSASYRAGKRTQVLMNWSIPYSCLLSGMFFLTRVRSLPEDSIVVSATKDPLEEVTIIDLPLGAAVVCQPRSLVGVVQEREKPIKITRHWRIGHLQSWLTLQLRFLVFHGPGQLVVKGCRGVRVEDASNARIINQAATLGFSANLSYANSRCETFLSYWLGYEDLFNDLFSGEGGAYFYEEMPNARHKAGITGRGLEGVLDGVLKAFGI